jgi:hypothetical protein
MTIEFSRDLIKGRIAEVVFEQMIRDEGKYTVIPFGYEHTMPTLAQYRHLTAGISKIMDNISDAPDFALISEDKTKVFLVEVKFRAKLDLEEIKECANGLLRRWEYSWIFVATPKDFYCSMCERIIRDNNINKLSEDWVTKDRQNEYLKLLNEFEK